MDIKPAQTKEKTPVDISEWNGETKAFLKSLTPFEELVFNDLFITTYGKDNNAEERFDAAFDAALLGLVDEENRPLLSETDRGAVKNASFKPLLRMFNAFCQAPKKEEGETLKKN